MEYEHLCKDCRYCDIEKKKCCYEENETSNANVLNDSDIYEAGVCIFFKNKE